MPLTACTIQEILSTDNPNQGRVKINNNFECLENTITELQVAANTGTTIVSASTNINSTLSYSGSAPIYTIEVVNNPTFYSVSSSTISTDGIVLNSVSTGTSILALGLDSFGNVVSSTTVSYWTSGSSGSYSIQVDNDSGLDATGTYAIAEGYQTKALGDYGAHSEGSFTTASGASSHAEGQATKAQGDYSHAEGYQTTAISYYAHSEGSQTKASGTASHAEGVLTTASGYASHTEGESTTASGMYSHAEGRFTISKGSASHAEGFYTTASTYMAHAEGNYSYASGDSSHAEGAFTTSVGQYSHSEGWSSISSGYTSHAEGGQTSAIGQYSHSEGYDTTALGTTSHAQNYSTFASGYSSHAEGYQTKALNTSSHAEGYATTSSGNSSHSEGYFTTALYDYSHSEGSSTKALNKATHAEGSGTTASGIASHSEGAYTTASGNYSHAGGLFTTASGYNSLIHSLNSSVSGQRSVVLGGQNITGSEDDTVYVPYLNISSIGSGTPVTSLAVDSNGMVVSASSDSNQVNLGPVLENTITTPPASPENQDRYIVPSGSTGEWSGQTNTIAEWSEPDSMWGYYTATTGDRTIVTTGINAGKVYQYSASSWVEIGITAPSSTPFYIGGTMTDAGSNKTSAIYRSGNVLIGGSSGTTTSYKFRVVGQSLLDGISTRMGWTSTNDITRTNKWHKVFRYRFLSDTYSSETFKLMMTDSGNSNGSGQQVEFNITIKKQVSSVYCSVLIDQKSNIYGNISDNFEVLYNNTTKDLSFYYKPTQNYATSSWTVLSNRNYSLTGRFSWDNLYLSASTLSGETSDSATINKKVVTYSNISSTGATTTHYGTLAIGNAPISGSTLDDVLLRSSDGTIKLTSQSALTYVNLGRVLFVSESGNNNTAQKGNINKPWKDLYIAKSAATSGDTVFVFPQTITYDNRASAGNPWNGRQSEMNLWKDGVTYYFMPGAKIVVYNQTVSGQDLYLIRPNGGAFETCTVLGHLDYQQNGSGPDTSVGRNLFFQGNTIGAESGYTFYAEVKNITSNHCEAVNIERSSISIPSSSIISKITIISQTENYAYLGGQSASGSFNVISFGDNVTEIKLYSKYRNYGGYYPWYILGNLSRSKINFYGEEVYNSGNNLCLFRDLYNGTVHINVNNIYYNTAFTPFGFYGAVISTISSGGWTCNLTANLVDYAANSQTVGIFYITTANNTINFKGNITTNTNSGAGRFIAATTQPNTINMDGDISLIGTATTTQVLLQPNGGATINYKGKITGNYGGPLIKTYNGTLNMNNSFVQITTDNSGSQIFQNGGASSGTCRINNSYIEMRNNSGALANGSYVKALINNSTIINTGTGTTLSNATNFGSLQLINSTIMTSGLTSVSYSSTGTPVVSSNSVANTNYSIASIYGTFNVINELTY